jgi:hypothetical protein
MNDPPGQSLDRLSTSLDRASSEYLAMERPRTQFAEREIGAIRDPPFAEDRRRVGRRPIIAPSQWLADIAAIVAGPLARSRVAPPHPLRRPAAALVN